MKILVAIASYGTGNDRYLRELLDTYRAMPHEVHVVILSNVLRDFGPDIEVIVGLPTSNPWSLPFGHKRLFANRVDEYDLFIYSEDDTPISQRNLDAFLRVTPHLRDDEIAGFLRFEQSQDGKRHYPEVHGHFHWYAESVRRRGPYTLAFFSNEHAACYVLTRKQLHRAIASGGFVVEPYEYNYDLLVTAATDPYTRCGFTKLLCVSHMDDFLVPHLPNKYIGRIGLEDTEFESQLQALLGLPVDGGMPSGRFSTETRLPRRHFSTDYYAKPRQELIEMVPPDARRVLSIGCGWGETEARLVERGAKVAAVPLDPVIAACARRRGVEIVGGSIETVHATLRSRQFDCLLASDVVHLLPDPTAVLASFGQLLAPRGTAVVAVPNIGRASVRWRRMRRLPGFREIGDHGKSGVQLATVRTVRKWLSGGGFTVTRVVPILSARHRWIERLSAHAADGLLASELVVAGTRRD